MSPVEERHIDYILEEEFTLNPDFLRYFIEQARITAVDEHRILGFANESDCFTLRSATTGKGETDVLVKYGVQNGSLPNAILIEDKIRTGFHMNKQSAIARGAKRVRAKTGLTTGRAWCRIVSIL
jgi:hypothetical protein